MKSTKELTDLLAAHAVVQCGAPPSVSNARPSADSGPYLTAITYSCQSGYDKTGGGTGHKQCSATGVWTPVAADLDVVCTRKQVKSSSLFQKPQWGYMKEHQ